MASGRKRSEASREAILEASLALLRRGGYHELTIDGIAAEAGVGKQTIYRWWPSKGAVVLEAMIERASREIAVPNTGRLGRDLHRFLADSFASARGPNGSAAILRGLMAEAQLDPAFLDQLRTQFIAARRQALRELLERGRTRGELRRSVNLELLLDLVFGPLWYRLLVQHAPLDARFARELAAAVMRVGAPRPRPAAGR